MEKQTPSISLNLIPYCNLTYPYVSIDKLDKEQILTDVKFWGDVLKDIDIIMKDYVKPVDEIPKGLEIISKCKKCGGSNLVFATGTSKANNKVWYAFDCQDCETENNGKSYPTRNFANMKSSFSANATESMGLTDDDDVPF